MAPCIFTWSSIPVLIFDVVVNHSFISFTQLMLSLCEMDTYSNIANSIIFKGMIQCEDRGNGAKTKVHRLISYIAEIIKKEK